MAQEGEISQKNKKGKNTTTDTKLYELEEILPRKFVRISKSSIVNSDKIYSIQKNLTASSLIEFKNTHKQIYVSRSYYKLLKN